MNDASKVWKTYLEAIGNEKFEEAGDKKQLRDSWLNDLESFMRKKFIKTCPFSETFGKKRESIRRGKNSGRDREATSKRKRERESEDDVFSAKSLCLFSLLLPSPIHRGPFSKYNLFFSPPRSRHSVHANSNSGREEREKPEKRMSKVREEFLLVPTVEFFSRE